jgi:integrase
MTGTSRARRRIARSDPRLDRRGLFNQEINDQLADSLPSETCRDYFSRANMPLHWLDAILENQPSYRRREKAVALNFRGLPATMVTEFVWSIERQVRLGMRIQAQNTTKLTRQIALVVADRSDAGIVSLVDMSREEWTLAMEGIRRHKGMPLASQQLANIASILGRTLDLLAHAYHLGPWWQLDMWNPLLDNRIVLREHEPLRHSIVYFGRFTTEWLREGAKWWLSRQLEREIYTWSTVHARHKDLARFQQYIDLAGCDGPHLTDDRLRLGHWIQGFRSWLRTQPVMSGPTKDCRLGVVKMRAAMTAPEQMYRFLFEEQAAAANALSDPRWLRLEPQHAVLFRFGEKPSSRSSAQPVTILSNAVISEIARRSDLLARPKEEGGFADDQLVRILGLLIKTGRRIREITALSFDPLLAIPFPDPGGHVARLRYQQTKIAYVNNTIMVDQEVVDLIRQQQEFARKFMRDRSKPDVEPKYLFLARNQNRNGDRPYPMSLVHLRLARLSLDADLRDELGNRVQISKTHTFRHTHATNLLNAGVPIHVAMRYMGHKSPAMFLHYAQTLSTVAEREFLRYKKVTADGGEYERDRAEMFEALALDKRTDRVLPNGYCTLPPRQACDKGNACLVCTKFVTDATFASALVRQREETCGLINRRQAAHAERFGEPMTEDNVWLRGRLKELAALDSITAAVNQTGGGEHDAVEPVRGAGTPQSRAMRAVASESDEGSRQ